MYSGLNYHTEKKRFPAAVLLIHLAAAVEKGLHKDPEKIIKYMIVAADKSARAIVRRIDYPHKEVEVRERYNIPWRYLTDYEQYITLLRDSISGI